MLVTSLTSHFMEKSPLKHLIVLPRPVSAQLFSLTQTNVKSQRNNLVKVLEKLVTTGHFKSKEADEAKDQYEKMPEELIPKYREEC